MFNILNLKQFNKCKTCGVYIIRNKITNDTYVGSTDNLHRRKNRHFNDLKANKHVNKLLQNSYNIHGRKNIEFIVLEIYQKIDKDFLYDREQYFMNKYKDNLLNMSTDPRCVRGVEIRHTEESKKKISEYQKNKPPISEETRNKLRVAALKQWEKQKLNS